MHWYEACFVFVYGTELIVSLCQLIMDFHSHLAHTEIIGLLGGKFYDKQDVKVLKIESVFPCKSTSTGIQVPSVILITLA